MIQDKIKMNGTVIWQPDKDMGYSFETTYTEGSTRSQAGEGHFTPMFTVEQYSYKASNIPIEEATNSSYHCKRRHFYPASFQPVPWDMEG